jgi:hypothetical protein
MASMIQVKNKHGQNGPQPGRSKKNQIYHPDQLEPIKTHSEPTTAIIIINS